MFHPQLLFFLVGNQNQASINSKLLFVDLVDAVRWLSIHNVAQFWNWRPLVLCWSTFCRTLLAILNHLTCSSLIHVLCIFLGMHIHHQMETYWQILSMPSLPSLDSTPRFIRISTPCTHFYNLQGMFLGLYFHSAWVDAFINALFLWQVLHLMNKMNLPAPFRMALPTPPLPSQVPAPPHPPPPPQPEEPRSADLSSDESELESSDVLATSAFLVPPL